MKSRNQIPDYQLTFLQLMRPIIRVKSHGSFARDAGNLTSMGAEINYDSVADLDSLLAMSDQIINGIIVCKVHRHYWLQLSNALLSKM